MPVAKIRSYHALLVAATVCCSIGAVAAEPDPPKPPIVLILADDLGYGDLGCYGCTDTRTPVLDRLAAEGVRFTNYYANAPECTPTRTALMTGRYQQRVGGMECAIGTGNVGRYDDAIRLAENHDLGLPSQQNVLIAGLNRAGYTCVGFGKWHLGYEPKFGPLHHGFDRFFGPLGGGVDYFYHGEWDGTHQLYENEQPVRREGYMTDLITDAAVKFLRSYDKSKPLFLYLPYTCPHTPIQHPDHKPPRPRTKENWNEGTREVYAAMVERMDQGIGRVLKTLDDLKLADDALVIFASDNGGTKLARNAPFSGYKGGLMEGGIREPCMIRWPGHVPKKIVSDQPAIMLDFTVSILRVAGSRPPKNLPSDGIDVLKLIEDGTPPQPRTLFWRQRRGECTMRAVRSGKLKYHTRRDGEQFDEHLFDLATDPAEKYNLLDARPDDVSRLKKLLTDWEAEVRPSR
ncbi:MAG: sulfatase-like hydrolase/transferase [Candidatus Nealsonbacteria bacterium]|nr:sulfatase-like hydrolase/transferase [Candidatus Nealsonbacteria bacterium]